MIKKGLSAFKGKRVLLLQGPLGPFFTRLAHDLTQAGADVTKVDFNGGDWLFSPRGAVAFRGRADEWPAFFELLLNDLQIDIVLLFGDCRPLHRTAHEVATRLGVEVGVFEEGYVRPDYITLERSGVNGNSQRSRNPIHYLNASPAEVPPTMPVGNAFWNASLWAVLYYLASSLLRPYFRHYRHHRPLSLWEGWPWLRGAWRKHYFAHKERRIQGQLSSALSNKYFLAPLQVHNDAQLQIHSEFDSVAGFIDLVMSSFGRHAPPETQLIIKHHPMDRGYHDHTRLIDALARQYAIQGRVRYLHDQHLPTLLAHARGVVLVNSTVGLSALDHGTPLMVCGVAVYDMPGLTFQGELDRFWTQAEAHPPNRELYLRFRNRLIADTQLNGSFYRRLPVPDSRAGLVWGDASAEQIPVAAVAAVSQQAAPQQKLANWRR